MSPPPSMDPISNITETTRLFSNMLERYGFPTLALVLILSAGTWLGYLAIGDVLVPLVKNHASFLDHQVETTRGIVENAKKQTTILEELADQTKVMAADHRRQIEILESFRKQ